MRAMAPAVLALVLATGTAVAQPKLEEYRSTPGGRMDILVREIERRPKSSVLEVKIVQAGASVGSSFFIVCSINRLARVRRAGRWFALLDETPKPGQMTVVFLARADESPAAADPAFKGREAKVVDGSQFDPFCDLQRP